ncbi:uncharacterized protein LOC128055129 [Budorcas taxicolor]|uniref:uncharacterized protein LOC128055129 n=1 Tax=Budorcas taxicolor TaxID=37181 RepID=UPI002284C0CE|nr:uncharacterized protein LOC128055129 [Budorcas taxicolor]
MTWEELPRDHQIQPTPQQWNVSVTPRDHSGSFGFRNKMSWCYHALVIKNCHSRVQITVQKHQTLSVYQLKACIISYLRQKPFNLLPPREAKNLFGDRTSSEESLLHSIRSGNLLGARNYPARGWVDDPRTPLAANSGSLISSEMSSSPPVPPWVPPPGISWKGRTLLWTGGTWPTGVPPGGGEGTAMLQGAQCGGVLLAAHNSGRPVGVGATFDLFQVL